MFMKRYRLRVSEVDECWLVVEAESEAAAKEKALDIVRTPWAGCEPYTSGNPRAVVTAVYDLPFPDEAPGAGEGRP